MIRQWIELLSLLRLDLLTSLVLKLGSLRASGSYTLSVEE